MTINSKFPFEILWPLRNYHIVYLKNNIKPCGEKLEVLQLKCASKKVALFKESIVASIYFLETGRNSCSWCEFPVSRNNCSHAQSHCLGPGLSSLGVPGVPRHTQILVDQLTLFQPGGTDYSHQICAFPVVEFSREGYKIRKVFG